jgi:predicted amidohydrolase YtcJ
MAHDGPVSAIAIRDGRIVAVGGDAEVWSAVGSDAATVDMRGQVVLPGFVDAHIHWCTYALQRRRLTFDSDQTLSDVVRRCRSRAADVAPGEWILGRGWDHSSWGRWPTAADLDNAVPNHPVALTRKDGHAVWLNSAALAKAGIVDGTPDPPGGRIVRDGGRPTGVLTENAMRLVDEAVPEPTPHERQAAMVDAWPDAWCKGLTGCHDMGYRESALFRDLSTLREAGELGLRFLWYFTGSALDEAIALGLRSGLGDEWLRVGGLKLFLDGTLGSQTAYLLEPYVGQPDNLGVQTLGDEEFADLTSRAATAGIATAVHAIGDAANRKALDVLSRLAPCALPHRIEHAQLIDPTDIPRFAQHDIVASMQPIHCSSDMQTADRSWGERRSKAYAWGSMLDAGARLAFGSDAPVETLDVFAGLHAAVTRQRPDGEPRGGWHPEERISISDALAAYSVGPAWASGQQDLLGSLIAGHHADLIVVDRDPLALEPRDLLHTRVLATMIEGVWVWQSPDVDFGGPRQSA